MIARTEKHPWRPVKLGNDDPFCTVNDEGSARGHIRDHPQIHILDDGLKIFVLRVGTIELQFGFERYAVGKSPFDAFLNGIPGRVDEIVLEFEHKIVPGVGYGEILIKYFVQSFPGSVLGIRFQLKEILE
jgi:hypothetical protein